MDSGAKKTLGIIAAAIGVISATVGLVKECRPEANGAPAYAPPQPQYQQPQYQQAPPPQPQYPQAQPVQQPVYSTTCCTAVGNCLMMDGAQPVGGQCFCFDMLGQMASGTVCQ